MSHAALHACLTLGLAESLRNQITMRMPGHN
jgi:hypothetical protein